MRRAVAAAAVSLAVVAPGDRATARFAGTTLSLTLHYPMVCGRPGRGPVVVRLPASFRLSRPAVRAGGAVRPFAVSGSTVTIRLPRPPEVTCMSIAEGVLPVTISGIHAPAGSYTVRATVNTHTFTARLRVR